MRRAFTLVEVLVVVAVVALLAAILFPAFARARENARRSSCTSNLKQIFLAHCLYREDYDGIFVPAAYRDANGARVTWADLFLPYTRSRSVYLCPSDSGARQFSFGLNSVAFADVEFLTPQQTGGINLGAVRFTNTSEIVMAVESGMGDDFQTVRPDSWKIVPPSSPLQFEGDARPSGRHFGRANVAFLDGHVKSLALDSFYRNQTPPDRFFASTE